MLTNTRGGRIWSTMTVRLEAWSLSTQQLVLICNELPIAFPSYDTYAGGTKWTGLLAPEYIYREQCTLKQFLAGIVSSLHGVG